ncbi:ABC transporter substrate-binding protein [Pseudonocardia kunmingensis]|uniref:Carbohydrate ABC transporter substrate-binding protein (CUT1 family) n=1 Tax=Pseudonocardia kunmingensis TaxID=630975 RepID=A0A543C1Y0_9PSEU|nr:sugar ABC transporter substrate-binding protein [Pseudonocardia kunmingensis]TQL91080.1 carbohydrate ABC transporter substrate-binding protein (CUT1 family) [Pseudonocardia kunmingensis]
MTLPTSIDRRSRRWHRLVGAALGVGLLGVTACGAAPTGSRVTLDYWLWESLQLPGYEKCADAFEAQHPDIEVRITQYGWGDYWKKLTAALVAGAGPDVFADHLTKYPGFVTRGVLLPLDELQATSDFDPSQFQEGLADLWVGPDGKQYGMPKDFDTIALFYDAKMLEEAGMTPADLDGLTWNPEDGGTFEDVIAHLSVDANGVRGDEPGFDPDNVVTYGLASSGSGGDGHGQTQWSWLAGAMGWTYTDTLVWAEEYNYDDPRVQAALGWLFGLVEKGFLASYEEIGEDPDPVKQLGSGTAAISPNGSWTISNYARLDGIELGVAGVPSGPVGHPVSMYNGLGDSISAQTEHPEEAAQFVAYLGSDECQVTVGREGVIFPARPAGTAAATEAFRAKGVDVSPFIELVENRHTVLFPVTDHPADVLSILEPALDSIYIGSSDASSLTQVNQEINALFDRPE